MMPNIRTEPRLNLTLLDKHVYMTDLVYVDGPILSLYRDAKDNWLYLWCDTDNKSKERWLLFPVSRADLISYLEKSTTLLKLIQSAKKRWLLDYERLVQARDDAKSAEYTKSFSRELRQSNDPGMLNEYLPAEDSYFDEELAPNISVARELSPTKFNVPIDGNWFIKDLDNFSNVYSQLYAFFYCTKPQFIMDIGNRVERLLGAPWTGGFSRVNLFDALQKNVPAVHDLKIHQMKYASPGDITIDALESVGTSVKSTVIRYRQERAELVTIVRSLNVMLSDKALKRLDLSKYTDLKLPLTQQDKDYIAEKMESLAKLLAIEGEFSDLSSRSPNVVVSAKVLLSVVSRIERMADFAASGLLDLERSPQPADTAIHPS
jgi:hypothetical protein